jgi:hypothetical protein
VKGRCLLGLRRGQAGPFVLGFASSEVNGRFGAGTIEPRQRRAQFAAGQLPAHHRLAEHLDRPVDWDAEFAADLDDVRVLIETLRTR